MTGRHVVSALAVLALGLIVTAPASAGGTSGAVGVKKNANVRIKNSTQTAYYVVVVPSTLQEPTTSYQAKRLGAFLMNPGKTVMYPVPAGQGVIYALAGTSVPTDPYATLPVWDATSPEYTVSRGRTQNATIVSDTSGLSITLP